MGILDSSTIPSNNFQLPQDFGIPNYPPKTRYIFEGEYRRDEGFDRVHVSMSVV